MRLIDADKFKQQIAVVCVENHYDTGKANSLIKLIDARPTAYDVEKVVEQIAEIMENEKIRFVDQAVNAAIRIIRSGGCEKEVDDE